MRLRRFLAFLPVALGAALATAAPASADETITTSGPLTTITISPYLNCAVTYLGDSSPEFYAATACGTFVSAAGVLYGPSSVPAGSGATGVTGYTAYTPVSQTPVSGAGTAADPYSVTTVVALGTSGLTVTEVDSYTVGRDDYRTSITLSAAAGTSAVDAIIYHAADCYLQSSDAGLGAVQNGNAPLCKALPGSADPNRIEGFFPLTPGSHYTENYFNTVWSQIGAQEQFPDTCACNSQIDNGAGLSWPAAVSPATPVTVSLLTVFSPVGNTPLALSKTADSPTSAAGAANGYTISISNSGLLPSTLTSITDTLPSGFTYLPGSTTGATTADPTVWGQDLTWTGTFTVPAATGDAPGTLTLHFGVTVSSALGTYTNSVTAAGDGVTVLPADGVAPIEVVAATIPPTTTPPATTAPTTTPPATTAPAALPVVAPPATLAATGPGRPLPLTLIALASLALGALLMRLGAATGPALGGAHR